MEAQASLKLSLRLCKFTCAMSVRSFMCLFFCYPKLVICDLAGDSELNSFKAE